jgi:hypothetical protein
VKQWYRAEGDQLEVKMDGFIVDIVRGNLLIEIQTTNFSAIKPKLTRLLDNHRVRLVYPIPQVKWIVHRSRVTEEVVGRRKSPKKGRWCDLFSELIRIPSCFAQGAFSVEVLLIEEEEIWCNDGMGSWRRRGASIVDRKLLRVLDRAVFECKADFLRFLPQTLADPFSNRELAQRLGIPVNHARRITYALRKIGTIAQVGMNRKEMQFARVISCTRTRKKREPAITRIGPRKTAARNRGEGDVATHAE